MKKIILLTLLVLALLAPGISKAQVDSLPNNGFQKWTNSSFPDDWDTASALSKKGIVFDAAQTGGTVQRITSFSYTVNGGAPTMVYPHSGTCFLDLATVASQSTGVHVGYIQSKFALATRPAYFYVQMGFFPQAAGEQPVLAITFTKWNTSTNKRDTVLKFANEASITNGYLAPWSMVYLALASSYNPNLTEDPDTALVQFQSSGGVSNGTSFNYANGTTLLLGNGAFTVNQPAGIEMYAVNKLAGISVYPNPFNGNATIQYTLSENSFVNLTVYDMQGREVTTLVNDHQMEGPHDAIFDGSTLGNGVYFYRLQSGNDVQTGKLILSK